MKKIDFESYLWKRKMRGVKQMPARIRGTFGLKSFVNTVASKCVLLRTVRRVQTVLLILLDVLQQLIQIIVNLTVVIIHISSMVANFHLRRFQLDACEQTVLVQLVPVVWGVWFAAHWT